MSKTEMQLVRTQEKKYFGSRKKQVNSRCENKVRKNRITKLEMIKIEKDNGSLWGYAITKEVTETSL